VNLVVGISKIGPRVTSGSNAWCGWQGFSFTPSVSTGSGQQPRPTMKSPSERMCLKRSIFHRSARSLNLAPPPAIESLWVIWWLAAIHPASSAMINVVRRLRVSVEQTNRIIPFRTFSRVEADSPMRQASRLRSMRATAMAAPILLRWPSSTLCLH
jgi:hypothetical protein